MLRGVLDRVQHPRSVKKKDFFDDRAVEFKGANGPLDAYTWVDKLEKTFESTDLPEEKKVKMAGERDVILSCLISAVAAMKLLNKGCQAFLAHVVDTSIRVLEVGDIPVVREFPDIFPEDLPGLPPVREIDFSIELVP
ncbi:hypothetical protein ACLB2K_038097 [Fragaria x ananassa]